MAGDDEDVAEPIHNAINAALAAGVPAIMLKGRSIEVIEEMTRKQEAVNGSS